MLPPCSQKSESSAFSHPFTAQITFARFLFYRLILLLGNCRKELDSIFWNFGFHILAGIVIRAKYCWKRMKEITAEIKFLAGIKNQCSVRKAGIGKPEQGVRQNSSKNFFVFGNLPVETKFRWKEPIPAEYKANHCPPTLS
jgi:hypothetical protein